MRSTTVRVSPEEREQLQEVKENMWGRHADDVPHGAAISALCENFLESEESVQVEFVEE